jgi:hypothetical protein
MKKELQEKYRGWFCWFIQRKIDALASQSGMNQTDYSAGTPEPAG